jgi:hypothetical protein
MKKTALKCGLLFFFSSVTQNRSDDCQDDTCADAGAIKNTVFTRAVFRMRSAWGEQTAYIPAIVFLQTAVLLVFVFCFIS